MVQDFKQDYEHGKKSEEISYPDLKKLFGEDLIHDKMEQAHFDYFKGNLMAELKTRDDVKVIDGVFNYTTRAGRQTTLDTLYFDSVKMRFAYQHNKYRIKENKPIKRFFMIWKCDGEYYYWELNWDKIEYYIEEQSNNWGHGQQERTVTNVKVEYIKPLQSISL